MHCNSNGYLGYVNQQLLYIIDVNNNVYSRCVHVMYSCKVTEAVVLECCGMLCVCACMCMRGCVASCVCVPACVYVCMCV